MEEVIARIVHDVDMAASACGPANAIEHRPQVEISDDNAKPLAIECKQRRGDPHGRNTRCVDDPTRLFEVDRGDVNVAGRERDRLLKIVPIASGLKLRDGQSADCATYS